MANLRKSVQVICIYCRRC